MPPSKPLKPPTVVGKRPPLPTTVLPNKPTTLPQLLPKAARAEPAPQELPANPEPQDNPVETVNPAVPDKMVPRLPVEDAPLLLSAKLRATPDNPVNPEPQETPDKMDNPEIPDKAVERLFQDPLDRLDLPDPLDNPETPEDPDKTDNPANSPKDHPSKDHPDPKDPLDNLANPVDLDNLPNRRLDLWDPPVTPDLPAQPVEMANPEVVATMVDLVAAAVATTAHLLVPLQDIKQKWMSF
jgi:hypothetical protein